MGGSGGRSPSKRAPLVGDDLALVLCRLIRPPSSSGTGDGPLRAELREWR